MQDYQYPLDLDWDTAELVIVMDMWAALEKANEEGMAAADFLTVYRKFKTVVKSIGEERKLGREFEKSSGYSLYHTLQQAKQNPTGKLKMKG